MKFVIFASENGPSTLLIMERAVHYVSNYQVLATMFILTCDRLICVLDTLKYGSRMTRKRMTIITAMSWVIIGGMGMGTAVSPMPLRHYLTEIGISIMVLYVVFAVITYTIIAVNVHRSKRLRQQPNREHQQRQVKFGKEFFVPFVLIISFITTYQIPLALHILLPWNGTTVKSRSKSLVYCFCRLLPYIGTLPDAITYVFFHKGYRENIKSIFAAKYCKPEPIPLEALRTRQTL